jgi:hypothetical protein
MTHDEHIQALRDLTQAAHDRSITEAQSWAEEAGAAGDVEGQQRNLAFAERLKAIPLPWETSTAA